MIIVQLEKDELETLIQSSVRKVLKENPPQTVETINQQAQLLTIDEVAELLHLRKPTVYSKHSKGEIPGVCKRGKRLYFEREVIIDWIKRGRKKSNAEIEQEAEAYILSKKKR
jgi:excisionase family DNA binding protein